MVSVDDAGRPNLDFRPLDVVRWEAAAVDAAGADNGHDLLDRFRETLSKYLELNPDVLTVLRVTLEGETAAHDEIMSDPERWTNEIRAAVVDEAGERAWVEKVKLRTEPPPARDRKPDGAVGELLALVDELVADPEALGSLSSELADLEKKLPRSSRRSPRAGGRATRAGSRACSRRPSPCWSGGFCREGVTSEDLLPRPHRLRPLHGHHTRPERRPGGPAHRLRPQRGRQELGLARRPAAALRDPGAVEG